MRMTAFVVIVSSFLLLLTWLLTNGLNLDAVRYDRQLRSLDQFSQFERALNREVLTARAGLSRNYDALARTTDAYDGSLNRLREAVESDPEESAAIEVLAAPARRQQDLIEQFKSRNALLQNSFAYFGLFSARLAASDHMPVVAAATTLEAAMLHLTLDTSPAAVREVQDRLEQLARLQSPPNDADSIQAALAHGGLLHDLLPATDALLKELIAAASSPEQDVVHSLILKRQLSARTSADRYSLLLYATSLMLLGTLVYLGLQLRARAIALRRRAAFEHVIAGISMRFINAHPQNVNDEIERALAVMAGCIGSDRAYLVLRGAAPRLHVWCKAGMSFSPGWPEGAPALAAQFDSVFDGIVHVPRVNRMPPGKNKDACVAVGLGGWACVTHVDKDGTSVTLGFDSIGRPCSITAPGELSLLRMALDTVVYAVGRQSFERERARLEMRLQQARRMETVGTFSSGIAHNFNNILGGILGHTEMVEEHLSSESWPRRNLDAIRQGAQRARELVDQILTFGRRGEGRRERICVKALVAETNALLAASLPSHVGLTVSETSEMTVVSAEPAQLQQIILNVCNNAAQAMDKPGVIEIQIGVREITEELRVGHIGIGPGRFVVVSVSDPGPGMDKATQERIFEPFFTTRPDGNGLGLATVREIVQEHDGAVEVLSVLGAGTRFDIWLPSVRSDAPLSAQSAPRIGGRGAGETVLVLEVERERLLRHEEILAALGYEPVGFTDLHEAAQAYALRARFDAALVCHQPGATSTLDLATTLHDIAPNLPIILATPSAQGLDAPMLAASGISEVVHRPLTSAELAGALSRCLAASMAPQLQ